MSGWGGVGESGGGGGGMSSPSVSGAAVGSAGSACSAPSSKLRQLSASPSPLLLEESRWSPLQARVVFWYSSLLDVGAARALGLRDGAALLQGSRRVVELLLRASRSTSLWCR